MAFSVGQDGKVFVCETFRQLHGVEDNRDHMNWLLDDLAAQTVQDRIDYFRRRLGEEVEKYTEQEDRIRLLQDIDGDGEADRSTVYVDGFNNIEDGTGAGVLARNGNVYYACIPKLWAFRDDDNDGKADRQAVLHEGYGVRVAFRGHDLHGLCIGPDGRLYFSIGDRGYNVKTEDGRQLADPSRVPCFDATKMVHS